MSESKFWCFTLNNPTEDEEQRLTDFLSSGDVVYGIFGKEVGESGTPHFQGFVIFTRSRRLSYLRLRLSNRGHFEIRRGNSTNEAARDYCKKDGDFEEFGTFPQSRQGHRSDLEAALIWLDEFQTANGRPPSSPDIAKHLPAIYLRYPRFRALAHHRAPRRRLEFGDPKQWQLELKTRLETDADDRTIDFIVDEEGGKGKTWFCRWMLSENDNVQILGIGKKRDVADIVDDTKTIFLFNIGRNQMKYLAYALLENLKDRLLLSGKYHGSVKMWEKPVHVVVLSNEAPDMTMLTPDRYNIIEL